MAREEPVVSYIGIDVGRTTCSIARWEPGGRVKTLASFTHTDPMVPCYATADGALAGQPAYLQWRLHAGDGGMLYAPTNFMGPEDARVELFPRCNMDGATAEDVYARLVRALVDIAVEEHRVPGELHAAVVVPSDWDTPLRDAIVRVVTGTGAFARVVTAAADEAAVLAAYADVERECEPVWVDKRVLVLDVGFGCSASLLHVCGNHIRCVQRECDAAAGGDAMDRLLYKHVTGALEKKRGIPVASLTDVDVVRVLQATRTMKEAMIGAPKQTLHVPIGAQKDVELSLSKAMMEMTCAGAIKAMKALLERMFPDAAAKAAVEEVIIVGGAGKMVKVQAGVAAVWKGVDGVRVVPHPKPEQAGARGASVAAAYYLSGKETRVAADDGEDGGSAAASWSAPPKALVAHVERLARQRRSEMTPLTRVAVRVRTETVPVAAMTPDTHVLQLHRKREPGENTPCSPDEEVSLLAKRRAGARNGVAGAAARTAESWFSDTNGNGSAAATHRRVADGAPPALSLPNGPLHAQIRGIKAATRRSSGRASLDATTTSEISLDATSSEGDFGSVVLKTIQGGKPSQTSDVYPFPLECPPPAGAGAPSPSSGRVEKVQVRTVVVHTANVPLLSANVPATVGVAGARGVMHAVLPRFTSIPPGCTQVTRGVVLGVDAREHDSVTVDVLQGEQRRATDNFHLASMPIRIAGWERAGVAKPSLCIEMTYAVDQTLTVGAWIQGAAHIGSVRVLTPATYKKGVAKYTGGAVDLPLPHEPPLDAAVRDDFVIDADDRPLDAEERAHVARRRHMEEQRCRAELAAERQRIKEVFAARKQAEAEVAAAASAVNSVGPGGVSTDPTAPV